VNRGLRATRNRGKVRHTPELHDAHTKIRGSFARILTAVSNVQSRGARCRSSTTVTGRNYAHVGDILGRLIDLGMDTVHLAVFSPVTQARGTDPEMFVRYSDAAAAIRSAIDRNAARLPPLSVKYIPFCFMTGYEQYVMNLYQQSFDPDDWNYYLGNKVRRAGTPLKRLAFDALSLAGSLLVKDRRSAWSYGLPGMKVLGFTRLVELLRKKRLRACRSCRYAAVCDFAWKDYVAHFGDEEFVAVPGERVSHPAWCYGLARSRTPGERVTGRLTVTARAAAPDAVPTISPQARSCAQP
jgi:MoaA/NifB/PqqE/SkfB family radical SAM enzyme